MGLVVLVIKGLNRLTGSRVNGENKNSGDNFKGS